MDSQKQLFGVEAFDQWAKYHKDNPRVFELFQHFATQALNAGRERLGTNMIIERIRWYVNIETESADGFKINNNFAPYYSRLLAAIDPRFESFFEFRQNGNFCVADIVRAHEGQAK